MVLQPQRKYNSVGLLPRSFASVLSLILLLRRMFTVYATSTRLDARGDLTARNYYNDPESFVRYRMDNGSASYNFTVVAAANETAGQAGNPTNDAGRSTKS
jgi:hypothetical protein